MLIQYQIMFIFFSVLSLFVQRKNQRKGAENDKFALPLRPLHRPFTPLRFRPNFAPFSVSPRAHAFRLPFDESLFFTAGIGGKLN
jgi:hypothetical protein